MIIYDYMLYISILYMLDITIYINIYNIYIIIDLYIKSF